MVSFGIISDPAAGGRPMRELTEKQRKWLEASIGPARYNATEAAKLAGYAGNRVTLATIGSKTRRCPHVAAEIEADYARWKAEFDRAWREKLDRLSRGASR